MGRPLEIPVTAGLLGGLTAAQVVPGVAKAQLLGIACTVVLAFASGTASGYLVSWTGRKVAAYKDDEFMGEAAEDEDLGVAVNAAPSLEA